MLPAKRAGARGADPWHTLHRETVTNYARNKTQEKTPKRKTVTKL